MFTPTEPTTGPTTDLLTDPALDPCDIASCDVDPCDIASCDIELPCWTADPELWFAESPADVEDAKTLCLPCPLREACLAGALDRREPWGVWGGQLLVAGAVVARKRPRGRPRKDAALLRGAA